MWRARPRIDLALGAPFVGVSLALAVWVYGGRHHWANGMVVTPAEALRPIFGDSADVYWRATRATAWATFRGLVIGSLVAFASALLAAGVPSLRHSIAGVHPGRPPPAPDHRDDAERRVSRCGRPGLVGARRR
jgi:ABC-type nitrate/sulfonate/bicarbonate transport system permease component